MAMHLIAYIRTNAIKLWLKTLYLKLLERGSVPCLSIRHSGARWERLVGVNKNLAHAPFIWWHVHAHSTGKNDLGLSF